MDRFDDRPSHLIWRLAALAFADVAGYSRLMSVDSFRTIRQWSRIRNDILLPMARDHRGRMVESAGDAILVEFTSVVEAVQWPIDVQQRLSEAIDASEAASDGADPMLLRIGINVDDVIDDEGILQSDGINIASRIHGFAAPGEIVVTAITRELIANRLPIVFRDLGLAAALGVKYLLTGSVRRQSERLRITTELVEVDHLRTIWAERFDGSSQDLFSDLAGKAVIVGHGRCDLPSPSSRPIFLALRRPGPVMI